MKGKKKIRAQVFKDQSEYERLTSLFDPDTPFVWDSTDANGSPVKVEVRCHAGKKYANHQTDECFETVGIMYLKVTREPKKQSAGE